ncbi:MAG: pirin family protein [Ilumatobacter sp.]|nr:pirin family protein [Ilumatobacter sp.]
MSDAAAIELLIDPRERPVGSGTVRRLLPWRRRRMVGPFVFADVMGPETMGPGKGMDVDAHPHVGLSTVTYLLRGRAVHRDSTGAVQVIDPGAVNWMTAGAGVTHTERSHEDDRPVSFDMFGLQTWVALPDDAEDGPAAFEHCAADQVPTESANGATVRLAVGTGFGQRAPIVGSSPLVLGEITLADGSIRLDAEHAERAVIAMSGDVFVDGHRLDVVQLAVLAPGSRPTLSGTGTAMVLGGEPVGERFIWWNFVHSDREVIDDAKRRWRQQEFPLVPGDHDPWVPLPGE